LINPRFFWKLSYPYLILLIFSLIAFGFFFVNTIQDYYISRTLEFQIQTTLAVEDELSFSALDTVNIEPRLQRLDKLIGVRITVISLQGSVIGDSRENPFIMENHIDRPEIQAALKGGTGHSIRYSHTLKTEMIYVAVPLQDSNGKISAVLRTSIPLDIVYFKFTNIYPVIIGGGILIIILASLIGMFISRQIGTPLLEMRNAARRFSSGNFQMKIYPPKDKELRSLADSLNSMAVQLDEKINIISEQRNTQQAVLESMKEGVIAVDYNEKIIFMNKTAEEILDIPNANHTGKSIQEVIRVYAVHKFIKEIISTGSYTETEIVIQHDKEKVLQLSGAALYDAEQNKIGLLLVINDITNLKHLDTLKRDLVANVSHELKTPITTIKGFLETLREGAINEPGKAERFLDIIYKNTERLNYIVEDLLTLSRLEQGAEQKKLKYEEVNIYSILKSSAEYYEQRAKEKNIEIVIVCSKTLTAEVDRLLIEQALGNLLDNAIKYSNKNTKIIISAACPDTMLTLAVKDEGFGIAKEHFPRLFERFYRIDKARSRDDGGTGLGLAIVKHIAQVHGGIVEVDSTPGKGSIFSITIPVKKI
jgi:two-component system phosphate regulon sensor histidine kinase PhoR